MRIFETLRAYQQTAALRAAIELDIFTAIGEGATTAADIAAKRGASERGVRILCDTIVTDGFLAKKDGHYRCAPDAAVFLDRRSPACIASVSEFLASPENVTGSLSLADCVRKGGTVQPGQGSVEPDNPVLGFVCASHGPDDGDARAHHCGTSGGNGSDQSARYRRRPRCLRHRHCAEKPTSGNHRGRLGVGAGSGEGERRQSRSFTAASTPFPAAPSMSISDRITISS